MALKYKYADKAGIPADSLALYVEKDDQGPDGKANGKKIFVLDVEGAVDKDRLDEFRGNNIKISNELRELRELWEGLKPEEVRLLITSIGNLKPAEVEQLLKDGKNIETVVATRTKTMTDDHTRKLTAIQTERDTLFNRLTDVEISQATLTEATKRGLRPTAVLDITSRARSLFKLSDGKVLAFEADGKTVRYGKDGVTPLSISDWLETQMVEAPHLFEPNAGGGAAGGGSGGSHSRSNIANPWKKESMNLTLQMKVTKENPELAKRFKAEAGVKEQ